MSVFMNLFVANLRWSPSVLKYNKEDVSTLLLIQATHFLQQSVQLQVELCAAILLRNRVVSTDCCSSNSSNVQERRVMQWRGIPKNGNIW
jgi:hypothetical protein